MSDLPNLYYYTDFETFKLILANGTLRFKESTKSNDKLDTNILYSELKELFNERYGADSAKSSQIQFLIGFFEKQGYHNHSVPVVACFTEKGDSRLLWDAYTMHRADRKSERYNGVCIQINVEGFANAMQLECEESDLFLIMSILYDKESRRKFLNHKIDEFESSVEELSKDEDQTQNIIPTSRFIYPSGERGIELTLKKCIVIPMMKFLADLQMMSPLFKHEFWREEVETRVLFCKQKDSLNKYPYGAHYFDAHITNACIEKVILGPEFSDEDMQIIKAQDNVIDVTSLRFVNSVGTGVITSAS